MEWKGKVLPWLKHRLVTIVVVAITICVLAAVLVFWSPPRASQNAQDDTWTCSMHPQVRQSGPGRCPICDMPLITISQLKTEQAQMREQVVLETQTVEYRELFKEIRTVGKLAYNDRRIAYITARIDGRVDRVYADFVGTHVKQHDHLLDIYSPELYTAQAELLHALEAYEEATTDQRFVTANLNASRTKLKLLGLLPEQIAEIEKTRVETTHLTIFAPIGGVVIEKNIREQQYVKEGDPLYQIAELDPIWLYLDIYEYDLGWIRYGQVVDVRVEAYPGQIFQGTVVFIDPFLDDKTRTVKVRVNLKNSESRLKPAMYASAAVHVQLGSDGAPLPTGLEGKYICPMHPEVVADDAGKCDICEMPLEKVPDVFAAPPQTHETNASPEAEEKHAPGLVLAVPKSAVLDTGRRQVVYRRRQDGAFELVDVRLGALAESRESVDRTGSYFPVLSGLSAGDEVVVQGGFLLDSQRQIEGMPSLLYAEGRSVASLHAGHAAGHSESPPSKATMPSEKSGAHRHEE